MSKLKTKSGAKKRFKVTASGIVMSSQAGKGHGMSKRTKRHIRNQRGMAPLCKADQTIVKKFMPYAF